jgi:hypothetical protein
MPSAPSLPLALRWLTADAGLTPHELAVRAGVSPSCVTGFLERPNAAILTWTTLLAALSCRLEVRSAQRTLSIALPRLSARRLANERAQWQQRRLTAFRAQILRQSPGTTPAEADDTARRYVEASAARLGAELQATRQGLNHLRLTRDLPGLRAALRSIAEAAEVKAEDLSLLSGLSLGAAQTVMDGSVEGRLETPLRLFSALAARLCIIPAAGGLVGITLAPPGDWRPEAPRTGSSSLTHEEIRALRRTNASLATIGRLAGISRQRVHAIIRAESGSAS